MLRGWLSASNGARTVCCQAQLDDIENGCHAVGEGNKALHSGWGGEGCSFVSWEASVFAGRRPLAGWRSAGRNPRLMDVFGERGSRVGSRKGEMLQAYKVCLSPPQRSGACCPSGLRYEASTDSAKGGSHDVLPAGGSQACLWTSYDSKVGWHEICWRNGV